MKKENAVFKIDFNNISQYVTMQFFNIKSNNANATHLPPFIIDYNIQIEYDIFKINKQSSAELTDFISFKKQLQLMRKMQLKQFCYDPLLGEGFKIKFQLLGEDAITLSIDLFDVMYQGHLQTKLTIDTAEINHILESLDTIINKFSLEEKVLLDMIK